MMVHKLNRDVQVCHPDPVSGHGVNFSRDPDLMLNQVWAPAFAGAATVLLVL